MKEKSLVPRFIFLAVLIALAALVLGFKERREGMDLKGGSSLIFKVNTEGNVAVLDEVIRTLKERVDPNGIKELQWRPVAADRFEVRMPAGSEAARSAKLDYLQALEGLTKKNIDAAFIRRVVDTTPDQRPELVAEKADPASERGQMILQAAELHDQMTEEWERIAPAVTQLRSRIREIRQSDPGDVETIETLRAEIDRESVNYDPLRGRYTMLVQTLREQNIHTRELQNILQLYVPAKLAREMPAERLEERRALLDEQLAAFKARHPESVSAIEDVVARYQAWAEVRGPLDDPADLIREIRRAGVLEFRIAPRMEAGSMRLSPQQVQGYLRELRDKGPQFGKDRKDPFQWFPVYSQSEAEKLIAGRMIVGEWAGQYYLLLSDQPGSVMLQGRGEDSWSVSAFPDVDESGAPAVGFTLDAAGATLFAALTGSHIGEPLAILLDDEVYSAPNIRTQISKRGSISGDFTRDEVNSLVRTLRAGSLRARVNPDPVSVHSVGPSLGAANIARGKRAAVIGLLCVMVFMLLYYLLAGFLADFALALNILFVLAAMYLMGVIFTLPGIAGLILTIGVAVDANVLIFERLREEQQFASDLKVAIRNAYNRAFSAIIDGNITTLLTCIILAWVGTQEIRGFGITLGIGLVISLFTALLVTRWIFRLLTETGLLKGKVPMLRILGVPQVDWFGKRKAFWVLSAVLIVGGLAALFGQGQRILGIEFRQGTRAVVRFKDDATIDGKLLTDALVADRLKAVGAEMEAAKLSGQNVLVNEMKTETRVRDLIEAYDETTAGGNGDGVVGKQEWLARGRSEQAFAALDADESGTLTAEELQQTLPEPRYQITTPESDHRIVREVIDAAFGGILDVRPSLDADEFEILANAQAPDLNVPIGPDGYVEVSRSMLSNPDKGGSYRGALEDNIGGVLMVLEVDPDRAMTSADLRERINNTRLQADREEVYVVQTQILPLRTVEGANKATVFAILIRTDDVPDRADNPDAWGQFAVSQKALLVDSLSQQRSLEALTNFDPAMTSRASGQAIVAIILSWLAIIVYVGFRFKSVQWGLAAVVCLIHDTLIVLGLVAMCGFIYNSPIGKALMLESFKIDLAMIAALLTVIGYSVNDTIVVFDRIRENRGKLTSVRPEIINKSVNQTLSRTILTSGTTLIVVVVMYIWGGDGIHGFSFALLAGVVFGTYSSVAIASPLLLGFKEALVAKVTEPGKALEGSNT